MSKDWIEKFMDDYFCDDHKRNYEAALLRETKIPSKLYKYRSFSLDCSRGIPYVYGEIADGYFHMAEWSCLNDEADGLFFALDDIRKNGAKDAAYEGLITFARAYLGIPPIESAALKSFDGIIRVCSLTEDSENLELWDRYSSHRSGICLEYDFGGVTRESFLRTRLFPVVYKDNETDIISSLDGRRSERPIVNSMQACCYKLKRGRERGSSNIAVWENENEWRIVDAYGASIDNRGKSWCKAPKITCVYLGKNIADKHVTEITKICGAIGIPTHTPPK